MAPIYPDDAGVIVGLLDLLSEGEVRVFECGTGHGALTLFLARAVHSNSNFHAEEEGEGEGGEKRKPTIYTLDISARHSEHARKIVEGYRGGMYSRDISFHVGTPKEFFDVLPSTLLPTSSLSTSEEEGVNKRIFTHAILDHPSSHTSLPIVSKHLLPAARIVLFAPSITQIIDAQRVVRQEGLPLLLERVVELGQGLSGGREWSLKFVRSRAVLRREAEAEAEASSSSSPVPSSDKSEEVDAVVDEEGERDESSKVEDGIPGVEIGKSEQEDEWLVSCRPKVGKVTQGGGFVALWSRIEGKDREAIGDVDTGYSKGLGSARATKFTSTASGGESIGSDGP